MKKRELGVRGVLAVCCWLAACGGHSTDSTTGEPSAGANSAGSYSAGANSAGSYSAGAPPAGGSAGTDGAGATSGTISRSEEGGPCDASPADDSPGPYCSSFATVCLDNEGDACDAAVQKGCPGTCRRKQEKVICSGLGMNGGCPRELACVSPPPSGPGDDESGQCLSPEAQTACGTDANACPEGFRCVRGTCVTGYVNCWSQVTCKAVSPPCPAGYAASRDKVQGDVAECYGFCVPIQDCTCKSNAECPAPAFCASSRTCELLAN